MESWRSYLSEDWRTETDWEKGEEKITLGNVHDYLEKHPVVPINVSELSKQIPSLPTHGAERVAAANLDYPIIVVKSGGQYKYVLDGNHRLQKAIDQGAEKIKAKILDLSNPKTPEVRFGVDLFNPIVPYRVKT